MIIKKNFLDLKDYQQIKEAISSGEFPWYFNENSLSTDGTIIVPPLVSTPTVFELKNPNENIQGRVR